MMRSTPIEDVREAARASNALMFGLGADGHPQISFRDGWDAARFLLELARQDARRPWIVQMAQQLKAGVGGRPDQFARALQILGQSLPFFHEKGEIFQGPKLTIERGGDCDCHARLIYALASAGGLPAELAFLHRGSGPTHVLARVLLDGKWTPLETTVRAFFGEDPIAAAKRLGVVRDDINSPEQITMGELTENVLRVAPGMCYRMRAWLKKPREEFASIDVGLFLRLSFEALGFCDVFVELEPDLLSDAWPWHDRDTAAPPGQWATWVTATWRNAESALDRNVGGDGAVSFTIASADETRAPDRAASTIPELDNPDSDPQTTMGSILSNRIGNGSAFFSRLLRIGRDRNVDPISVLMMMYNESGLNPGQPSHVKDSHGNPVAWGISQIMTPFLRGVGFLGTGPDFLALSAVDQLEFVDRFYAPYTSSNLDTPERVYQANFLPGTLSWGSDPTTVLAVKGGGSSRWPREWVSEAAVYRDNSQLDHGGKGFITVGDLGIAMRAHSNDPVLIEAVARLRAAAGGALDAPGIGPVLLILGIGGAAVLALARSLT